MALAVLSFASCKKQSGSSDVQDPDSVTASEETNEEPTTVQQLKGKISKFYGKAKQTGGEATGNVKEWIGDRVGDATSAGKNASQEAADWLKSAFQQAKARGETTAQSAKDWVMDDLKNMSGWQYQTLTVPADEGTDKLTQQLNEQGNDGWECFHVETRPEGRILFFKRKARSYARNIPIRDLLRLLPLLDSSDNSQ